MNVLGHELNPTSITIFAGESEPFFIFAAILFGGFLAFLMEMSEYLLLVYTSGITLNIFGIIKVRILYGFSAYEDFRK